MQKIISLQDFVSDLDRVLDDVDTNSVTYTVMLENNKAIVIVPVTPERDFNIPA